MTWFEHGERNTKFFLNLQKRNFRQKSVTKLKLKDNTHTNDQFEILQEEKQFYESLYMSKNVDAEKFSQSPFFKPDNITPLSQDDKLACENPISTNECLNALKEFTNSKTPGTDGFTSKFYKFFWPELWTEMIASFNYAFHSVTLSISQTRGISLNPKKDKDTLKQKLPKRTELRQKFNLEIPFTLYYGLISAIPKEWNSSLEDALSRDNDIVETQLAFVQKCLPCLLFIAAVFDDSSAAEKIHYTVVSLSALIHRL